MSLKYRSCFHHVWEEVRGDQPLFRFPQAAVVGPSNSGKSTLINALLGMKNMARTGKTPGKTANIHFFHIDDTYHIVDLPGFGYAKRSKGTRNEWKKITFKYFSRNPWLRHLFFILDIRRDLGPREYELFDWFKAMRIDISLVLNKQDKLAKNKMKPRMNYFRDTCAAKGYAITCYPTSALKRLGIEPIIKLIVDMKNTPEQS